MVFESCGEMSLVDIAYTVGYLRDVYLALAQQTRGLLHAQIAEEEGLFTLDDVICGIRDKMIRRHPHIFGEAKADTPSEVLKNWEEIKKKEKAGRSDDTEELFAAFDEARQLIDRAETRKREKMNK